MVILKMNDISNNLNIHALNPCQTKYKYPRCSFSNEPSERAYVLGLRSGDIYARKHYRSVIVEVTSPKSEQIEMFKNIFSKYGKIICYEKRSKVTGKTTRAYCFLNESFNFLIQKTQLIPDWILKNNSLFYSFLSGYVDSEGSWIITEHKKYDGKYKDLVFSLGTCDKVILEQVHRKLKELGFNSHFYLVRKAGVHTNIGICNFDLYRVMLMRAKDVIKLAKILLPLSKHEGKRDKILKIIELEPSFKRMLSPEIPCPLCNHKKIWRRGSGEGKIKYQRYICPNCKKNFSEKTLRVSSNA